MKKLSILTCTMIALGFMAITVWADSPHFIRCSASGPNNDGDVSVCFKISGLGTNELVTVTATATATATYGCLNGGQQCPNAQNKFTVSGPVSAQGTFPSGKNGTVSQCLTLQPPSAGSFSCPPGQKLVLIEATYTNVSVSSDRTGTETCNVSGTFDTGNRFPQCP
jgi:hypothetical protein